MSDMETEQFVALCKYKRYYFSVLLTSKWKISDIKTVNLNAFYLDFFALLKIY